MFVKYANLVHNILNILIALSAALTAFLIATGCTQLVTGSFDCTASWLPPQYSASATAIMGVLKTVMNLARDGFGGLYRPQPPIPPQPGDKDNARNLMLVVVLLIPLALGGCKTFDEALQKLQNFIVGVEDDIDEAWASVQRSCSATQIVVANVKSSAAALGGKCKVMSKIEAAEAAIATICQGPQPSASKLIGTARTVLDAYKAAKEAEAAGC